MKNIRLILTLVAMAVMFVFYSFAEPPNLQRFTGTGANLNARGQI